MSRLYVGLSCLAAAIILGSCGGQAQDLSLPVKLGEIDFSLSPSEAGQVILSREALTQRLTSQSETIVPLTPAERAEIIAFIQSTYDMPDDKPPAVQYENGEFFIQNLKALDEITTEIRFAGPKKLADGVWAFDKMSSKGSERNDGQIKVGYAVFARPQTEGFEQSFASVANETDLSALFDPQIFIPLLLGSTGSVQDVRIDMGFAQIDIDSLAWTSNADAETLSFRADGLNFKQGYDEINIGHISAMDLNYETFLVAPQTLSRLGGFDFVVPGRLLSNINPFSTPYSSLSIQKFNQTSPMSEVSLSGLDFWVTSEQSGMFEKHEQIKGLNIKGKRGAEYALIFKLLPLRDLGLLELTLDYRAHSHLDKKTDSWTETIELASPELSHFRVELDVDGYHNFRQVYASVLERGYRPNKKELPDNFEQQQKAALEAWRIKQFDIYWDDRDIILRSIKNRYSYHDENLSDEEWLAENFDRDLGEYWFGMPENPILTAFKEDYIKAMRAAVREDGILAVTTNTPTKGVPINLLLSLEGKTAEDKQAEFMKRLGMKIRHHAYEDVRP